MSSPMRLLLNASTLAACLALAACSGGSGATLTVEGTYSGTDESSCQVALRNNAGGKLQQSLELAPSFRADFDVKDGKGSYYVEIQCGGGRMGRSPPFDFDPPRAAITLADIEIR